MPIIKLYIMKYNVYNKFKTYRNANLGHNIKRTPQKRGRTIMRVADNKRDQWPNVDPNGLSFPFQNEPQKHVNTTKTQYESLKFGLFPMRVHEADLDSTTKG